MACRTGSTLQLRNEELPERGAGYRSAFKSIVDLETSNEPHNAGGRPMNMLIAAPSGQTIRRAARPSSSAKNKPSRHKFWLAVAIALGAFCAETGQALAGYLQTNLVSDIPGLAIITDPLLVNPWGMSRSPTSPFWTSNQGTNSATLYAVTGTTTVTQVLAVNAQGFVGIPTTGAGPQGPTGQVNNTNTASFQLTPGTPSTSARFIFADLNGTISGWAGGLTSTIMVTTPAAVYTGLAINTAGTRLYGADNAGGRVNIFDSSFSPVNLPGAFMDPNIPAGFVPFNVQNIGGKIYVTYAPAGLPAQRAATPGQGSSMLSIRMESCSKESSPIVNLPRPGVSRLPVRIWPVRR